MTNKKMTKREAYNIILGVLENSNIELKADVIEVVNNELELLARKASAKSKADIAKAEVDKKLADILYNILLEEGVGLTATELLNTRIKDEVDNINVQKITHLLTGLLADNKVHKEVIKRKSYYTAI